MVKSVIGSVTTYYPRREYELRVEGASEPIDESGGLKGFSSQYFPGYTEFSVFDIDSSRSHLLIRWMNNMANLYDLQEK